MIKSLTFLFALVCAIINSYGSTLHKKDTVIIRDPIIIQDHIIKQDTIIVKDTVVVKVEIEKEPLVVRDTLFIYDTTFVKQKKRKINNVKTWSKGIIYEATDIDVVCVWDDLSTTAKFLYNISDSLGNIIQTGDVEISGQKYIDYATKPNHDDRAIIVVMRELNLLPIPNGNIKPKTNNK